MESDEKMVHQAVIDVAGGVTASLYWTDDATEGRIFMTEAAFRSYVSAFGTSAEEVANEIAGRWLTWLWMIIPSGGS